VAKATLLPSLTPVSSRPLVSTVSQQLVCSVIASSRSH
jgi:hypothetical protein